MAVAKNVHFSFAKNMYSINLCTSKIHLECVIFAGKVDVFFYRPFISENKQTKWRLKESSATITMHFTHRMAAILMQIYIRWRGYCLFIIA